MDRVAYKSKEPLDRFHQTGTHHPIKTLDYILQRQGSNSLRVPAVEQSRPISTIPNTIHPSQKRTCPVTRDPQSSCLPSA